VERSIQTHRRRGIEKLILGCKITLYFEKEKKWEQKIRKETNRRVIRGVRAVMSVL